MSARVWRSLFFLTLLSSLLLLPACQGELSSFLATPTVFTPTPVRPSPSPSRTATIVWFPTKTTPTRPAAPSAQPTSNLRPATGEIIFRDLFEDASEWTSINSSAGSLALSRRELSIAVSAPKEVLASLRRTPPPPDFYLEITANAALCRADDAYGVLFRASSLRDGYRLLVNCRGEMRLERLKGFEVIPLEDWFPSTVTGGAPSTTRLGIWAARGEFRVFANDIFQFSARDPVWTSGQIGLYARSAGSTPLTVSFSDLSVRSVDPARIPSPTPTQPTSTATPRRTP